MGGYWFLKPLYEIRSYDITLKPEPSRVRTSQDQEGIDLSGLPLLLNRWVSCDLKMLLFGLAGTSWHIAFLPWDEWKEEHMKRESWGKISAETTRQMCRFQSPSQIWLQLPRPACFTPWRGKMPLQLWTMKPCSFCPIVSTVAVTLFPIKRKELLVEDDTIITLANP